MQWEDKHTYGIWGAALGAAALAIVGFTWGDWHTSGGAKKVAEAAGWSALIPVCVDAIFADPAARAQLDVKKPHDYDDVVRDHLKQIGGRTTSDYYQFKRDCGYAVAARMKAAAK